MLTYSYLVISFLFDKSKGSVNHLIKHVQQILIEHLNQHTFVLACYRYNPDVTIFHERGFFTQAFLSMDVALATPWRQLVCSVTPKSIKFPMAKGWNCHQCHQRKLEGFRLISFSIIPEGFCFFIVFCGRKEGLTDMLLVNIPQTSTNTTGFYWTTKHKHPKVTKPDATQLEPDENGGQKGQNFSMPSSKRYPPGISLHSWLEYHHFH